MTDTESVDPRVRAEISVFTKAHCGPLRIYKEYADRLPLTLTSVKITHGANVGDGATEAEAWSDFLENAAQRVLVTGRIIHGDGVDDFLLSSENTHT